jgi:hypothetical protein
MSESEELDAVEGPQLWNQVFARIIAEAGDPCIYIDIPLRRVEEIESYFNGLDKPGSSMRHVTHFEEWFFAHCMGRQIRPVETLEAFRLSSSPSIRAIAVKALKERYSIAESDRLEREMAELNRSISLSTQKTMIAMWVTAAATLVTAFVAVLQFLKLGYG